MSRRRRSGRRARVRCVVPATDGLVAVRLRSAADARIVHRRRERRAERAAPIPDPNLALLKAERLRHLSSSAMHIAVELVRSWRPAFTRSIEKGCVEIDRNNASADRGRRPSDTSTGCAPGAPRTAARCLHAHHPERSAARARTPGLFP